MALAAGTRLGPYEILAPIGAGGMGEVYRAKDTKLGREVALKTLPPEVAGDAERLARFQREAHLLAALNHPNIASIYGLEESDGQPFLVLELVEGEDLAERLKRGRIPMDEALGIAKQIAEGLEEAHEKGIVHRDLKPANVKLTPDGRVKVLDFGLARAWEGDGDPVTGASSGLSQSPTLAHSGTQAGIILGTAAYMSPEQARGKPVDKRADIWAFGCVLYEMVTGQKPFSGEDVGETLAAVIKEHPPMNALPREIRPLVESCLEKDPRVRLRDIGDAWRIAERPRQPDARAPLPRNRWPWAITAAALALTVSVAFLRAPAPAPSPSAAVPVRLDAEVGVDLSLTSEEGPPFAISPDGTRLVLVTPGPEGKDHLALRLLSSAGTTVLAGTEDAASPFFSPDSRWVAFFAAGKLKKVAVDGGTPVVLCDAPDPRGGSWGDDGNIIFASERRVPLSRVSAAGGEVTSATELDHNASEVTNRFPKWLPGATAFLFQSRSDGSAYTIHAQSVQTGERTTLVENGYLGHYLPSDHLLFFRQGQLYAAPMDVRRLEVTGAAVPVVQDLRDHGNGWAYFDVSPSGTLVYMAADVSEERSAAWLHSSGSLERLPLAPGPYLYARASPDETKLVLPAAEGNDTALWLYEVAPDRLSRVATIRGRPRALAWAPDSQHLVYSVSRNESEDGIYWIRADGAGTPVRLLEGSGRVIGSVAPDGRRVGYWQAEGGYGLWTVAIDTRDPDHPIPGKPEPFLPSDAEVRGPIFSPDGAWVSYLSLESGRSEMYVQAFPEPGRSWQISPSGPLGGALGHGAWSSGNRLYYRSPDDQVLAVDYRTDGVTFNAGRPRPWSSGPVPLGELSSDGSRILVLTSAEGTARTPPSRLTFVVNFFESLRSASDTGAR